MDTDTKTDSEKVDSPENNSGESSDRSNTEAKPSDRNLYNPNEDLTRPQMVKNFFIGSRRRKLITLGTAGGGGIIGSLIFIMTIAAGPAQLVQLSQVLQNQFNGMDNASSNVISKEIIFSGSPESVGATRLGNFSQLYLKHILNNMEENGITFKYNSLGGMKEMQIDPAKLAANNSDFASLDPSERTQWLADQINRSTSFQGDVITPDQIKLGSDGVYHISPSNFDNPNNAELPIDVARALKNSAVELVPSGPISGALDKRILTRYFNVERLFEPLKYFTSKARRAAAQAAEAKQEQTEEVKDTVSAPEAEATKLSSIKSSLSDAFESDLGQSAQKVLIASALLCTVYKSVNTVIDFNNAAIVAPAALGAVRFVAIGHEVKAGQGFNAAELGNVVESLTNSSGQTIWSAQALQAEENIPDPTGPNLPTSYGQAFAGTTTANNISSYLNSAGFTGLICSTAGQIVQGAIGIIALVAAVPSGGLTLSYFAANGALVAGTAGALYMIQNELFNFLKDSSVVPQLLSGPLGGNIAAYGARAASNITGMSEGAVALPHTNTTTLSADVVKQLNNQFASESIFKRIFDIDDYRSLLGKIADDTTPNFGLNILKFAKSVLNVGQIFRNIASIFSPRASADTNSTYDWGFPQYGIPPDILNSTDPTMQNPYANADIVANFLNSGDSSVTSYEQRVTECFGDTLTDTGGVWDVVPTNVVYPNTASYSAGNCNNYESDPMWKRIILFVFDTRVMQGSACYLGSTQACTEVGMNND